VKHNYRKHLITPHGNVTTSDKIFHRNPQMNQHSWWNCRKTDAS